MNTVKRIKFLIPDLPDPNRVFPLLRCLDRNRHYANFGPLLTELEKDVAEYLSKQQQQSLFLTTVANATLGLELGLQAFSLPKDSYVLVPSLTFPATATAVVRVGLCPLFADVDPHTWQLTPEIAYAAMQEHRIQAVIPVATYNQPVDAKAWELFSTKTGIPVLLDAAGAFDNQIVTKSTPTVFSMHATKLLGIGEGGIVVSQDEKWIHQIRMLSNFGQDNGIVHAIGTNAKLSEYHAAVATVQFYRWQEKKERFKKLHAQFTQILEGLPNLRIFHDKTPQLTSLYPVQIQTPIKLSAVINELAKANIEIKRTYLPPLHQHPAFKDYPRMKSLGVCDLLNESVLCLPFHAFLLEEEMYYMRDMLKKLLTTS